MKKIEILNKRFNIKMGVIVLPKDKNKIPSEFFENPEEGWIKNSYGIYQLFHWDISPDRLKAALADMEDFNKKLEAVEILSLSKELNVTKRLWDCSYVYWETRRNWRTSFSLPEEAGEKLIKKIRKETNTPVVLYDGDKYWEIPTPLGTDGIFKGKYSPTVILPNGYKYSDEYRIVYDNIGRGALTEYWGDYRI